MKPLAALAVSVPLLMAQGERVAPRTVTAIRNWSLADVTRVAIEVSGDFEFRTDRLHSPERVYYDILKSRPSVEGKRFFSKVFDDDKLVLRVRVAQTNPGVTRVVLELAPGVDVTTSQLSNPARLMVEVRPGKGPITSTKTSAAPALRPAPPIKAELPVMPPAELPQPPAKTAAPK